MSNKTILLIRGHNGEDYSKFKSRILDCVEQAIGDRPRLKITLTAENPPKGTIIPFSRKRIAAISIASSKLNYEQFTDLPGFTGSYQVKEALPIQYLKDWEDLEPTPGVCLLTIFRKKPGQDRVTFLTKWHQGHTPLSLRIHPLWNYNRNVVESFTHGSEPFDGIVEEQFKSPSDLLNPIKFFGGNPLMVPIRMLEVYFDVRSFIDYQSIETFWAQEIHLRS